MARIKTKTRTLHNRGHRRLIGQFPSRKNRAFSQYESLNERDAHLLLECQPEVVSYEAQPETVRLLMPGSDKPSRYTPDILVHFADGTSTFLEVKSFKVAQDPEWQPLFEAAAAYFATRGQGYRVVTDRDIRQGHLIDNFRLLYRFADWPINDARREALLALLPPNEPMAVGALRRRAREIGVDIGAIYRLLFDRALGADLVGQRVNDDLLVWRAAA